MNKRIDEYNEYKLLKRINGNQISNTFALFVWYRNIFKIDTFYIFTGILY